MNNRFLIIVIAIIAIFFGIFMFAGSDENGNQTSVDAEPTNHVQGEGTAGVTLIEYGDFQCPACASYFPVVKQVKEQYGDQITFQFRHFPLVQIHQHALLSSKAAEAAGKQGKFFEMHDLLYQTQDSWSSQTDPTETFVSFAGQLKLDQEQFREDMFSQEVNDKVLADLAAAQDIGATGTPTFVLNGEKIESPGSLEEFYELIDNAIAENQEQE